MKKSKKFIVGVILVIVGIIGLFGIFTSSDKISLLIGSLILIIVGVSLLYIDYRYPIQVQNTPKNKTTSATIVPDIYVWITPNGKKFHYNKTCCNVSARRITINEARKLGRTACEKCCSTNFRK